jgi:hypothetical protein
MQASPANVWDVWEGFELAAVQDKGLQVVMFWIARDHRVLTGWESDTLPRL